QGLTISDPPLSRTVGVALANDVVRVYFERGAPLPARRTFVHHTVESVARGTTDCVLKIPIVQGEYEQAHLCRLVGSLEIGGEAGQKARRMLIELDAGIEEIEFEGRWPEVEAEARERLATASHWVSQNGTPAEQKLLGEAAEGVDRARKARSPTELQRQMRVVQ